MHWLRTEVWRQVVNFLHAARTTCEEEEGLGAVRGRADLGAEGEIPDQDSRGLCQPSGKVRSATQSGGFGLSSKEMGYEAVRENQGQVTDWAVGTLQSGNSGWPPETSCPTPSW